MYIQINIHIYIYVRVDSRLDLFKATIESIYEPTKHVYVLQESWLILLPLLLKLQGSLRYPFWTDQTMQMYGKFDEFARKKTSPC